MVFNLPTQHVNVQETTVVVLKLTQSSDLFQILSASSITDSQVYALESSNPSMSTSVSDGWQRGNVQSDCEFMDDDPALDDIFNGIDVNSATQRYVAEKFDVTHFRDFQKQPVEAALKGKDTLIIQPYSSGYIYQILS